MDDVSFRTLLQQEQARLRSELRADAEIDKNRPQSLRRLDETLGKLLLRYNAAASDDPARQAAADGLASTARDMLGLLEAGTARREVERRRVRAGGWIGALLAVIFMLAAALAEQRFYLAGCILGAVAVGCAFIGGRLWYGEREVRVRAELDPDVVLRTLDKAAGTMDRKLEDVLAESRAREEAARAQASPADTLALDEQTVHLIGDLLEAERAENGEFALRQLKKVTPWLRGRGIEPVEYSAERADLFELLPTKRESSTQRPALVRDNRLLLAGRATEHVEG